MQKNAKTELNLPLSSTSLIHHLSCEHHIEPNIKSSELANRDSGIFEDFSPTFICSSESFNSTEPAPSKDIPENKTLNDSIEHLSNNDDSNLTDFSVDESSESDDSTSASQFSHCSFEYTQFETEDNSVEESTDLNKYYYDEDSSLAEVSSVDEDSSSFDEFEDYDSSSNETDEDKNVEKFISESRRFSKGSLHLFITSENDLSNAADYTGPLIDYLENDSTSAENSDFSVSQTERSRSIVDNISTEVSTYECKDSYCSSDNASDIENKMAETEIKMGDAILSNGKEDLSYFNEKLRQLVKQHDPDDLDQPFTDEINKKNYINNNEYLIPSAQNGTDGNKTHLNNMEFVDDVQNISNKNPTMDVYEKECPDVAEKDIIKCSSNSVEDVLPSNNSKENDNLIYISEKEKDIEKAKSSLTLSFDENSLRPRPSPKQRRKERTALRRALPNSRFVKKNNVISNGDDFDVYAMDTSLPKIDWETIEAHLQATKKEQNRRRTDREEIRRKLAMGTDDDFGVDRPLRKPSLHSRLQNGTSLQICFMNETASDCDSQCSDTESTQDRIDEAELRSAAKDLTAAEGDSEFALHQARLQAEARLALSQAKDMARMQMQIEKQSLNKSPISEIVRNSFNKIGFPFPDYKRRMSRQILTDMNVAQLQVIVNDMHTQIENLNEGLVTLLLERDDLHMGQDSMLVDIEDLTKHLGAKHETVIETTKFGKNTKTFVLKSCPVKMQKTVLPK